MKTDHDLPDLNGVERIVVTAAREELLPRFARAKREFKADGSIVTEADLAVQSRIQQALAEAWPEIGFLGEEMPEAEQREMLVDAGNAIWVLDPLDGTSNFTAGLPFFSVSLALVIDGAPVLGIVHDPVREECFTARRRIGAWCNGEPLKLVGRALPLRRAIACVDFKRLDVSLAVRLVEDPPYSSQRSLGSVALEWCWLAAGRAHVYLHGRQKLWDYAAGSLVLREAGGHSISLDGQPVFRAGVEPRSAVAALDAGLFREWCDWLGIPVQSG